MTPHPSFTTGKVVLDYDATGLTDKEAALEGLDRAFDYFDTDASESLSPAEMAAACVRHE